MPEIHELSAADLRAAYDARSLSPIEVVDALYERIDRLEPSLRAFITQTREEARSQAKLAAREWRFRESDEPPALLGIPITIKDLVDVQGAPTTMGSLVTSRQPAARDELFVERLREAGAVFLGKTNTSEFGLAAQTMNRLGAPTANPWNIERTAGGSSGGAAAACAAGYGPLHHGTDGGGSVRVPAACCGVFGFKPTGRRIPRRSRGAGMSQISSDGVLARSVVDIAMMMTAMSDDAHSDPIAYRDGYHSWFHSIEQEDVKGLRVAWTTQLGWPTPCEPEIAQRVERAAALLSGSGARVEEASPPIADPNEVFPTLSAVGAAANYGLLCVGREEDLSDYTQGSLRRGRSLTGVQVAQAYADLDVLQRRMRAWFQQYDILLTPTSAISALRHGESIDFIAGKHVSPWTTSILYTPLANLIQSPAIAVPAGLDSSGLPISVQLVAKEGNDAAVLRCAAMLDAAGLNETSRLAPV
ncbi:MAG: amidase [Chloroflexi bacterium]|nr:amidase [Chloroflexota bacterium]MYD17509.1 amidase [Chloroflexota bacterium]